MLSTQSIETVSIVGKVWSFLDYFHPDTNDLAWAEALDYEIKHLSAHEYSYGLNESLTSLLTQLNDPATTFWTNEDLKNISCNRRFHSLEIGEHSYISLEHLAAHSSNRCYKSIVDDLGRELLHSSTIILDLRLNEPGTIGGLDEIIDNSSLAKALISRPLQSPGFRGRMYCGLPPAVGSTSGGYYKMHKSTRGRLFEPLNNSSKKQVVFLVNFHSVLPNIALAMQFAGDGYIIADGPLRARIGNRACLLPAGDGFVDVRLTELIVNNKKRGRFIPDESIPATADKDFALQRAHERVCSKFNLRPGYPPQPSIKRERRSPNRKNYPETSARLRAVFKIWVVFKYFFPYLNLMDNEWDTNLIPALTACEQSNDAESYVLAISKLLKQTCDSHVWVNSQVLRKKIGEASPPFECRLIQRHPVIVRLTSNAKYLGLSLGDQILKIDGKDWQTAFDEIRSYVPASTKQAECASVLSLLFKGKTNSTISVEVFDGNSNRTVICEREILPVYDKPSVQPFQIIDHLNRIGYADLTRLQIEQIDKMFEQLEFCDALIFDLRGFPKGTGWEISGRLNSDKMVVAGRKVRSATKTAAIIKCPKVTTFDTTEDELRTKYSNSFATVGGSRKPSYSGKTVLLVDERTISQGEFTAQMFKAANNTILIGSQTAGANGDLTNFCIPGNLRIELTGQAVFHPDGSVLQRVGLTPDVVIQPTIEGVRSNKDEVLEGAHNFLVRYLCSLKT